MLTRSSGRLFEAWDGLRCVHYGPSTDAPTLWHALDQCRGASITLQAEPGVISRTLPERAQRRLAGHLGELIVPRSRTLPAERGFWEYGAELAPDLTSSALRSIPAQWPELPAVRSLCVSFSRAHLGRMLEHCRDSWLPALLPEELSLRWWSLGGSIVCDTRSSFNRAYLPDRARSPASWARQRLSIGTLHLSDARLARLQSYLEAVVPGFNATAPPCLLDMRGRVLEARERDDDWYSARFGFDVFAPKEAFLRVGS